MHTKGPWRAWREDRRSWTIKSEDFGNIASIHDPYADDSESRARLETNARLIAAAPELLAALKALVGADGAATTDEADRQHFLFLVECAAHAVIAKAEGRD